RLGEPRVLGAAVGEPALAGPDAPDEGLAVGPELGEGVVPGVRDEEVPAGQLDRLRGEAQRARRRRGRHVRAVAPVQRALRVVLRDELLDEGGDRGRVPLPRHLRHDVALGVDHDERRPRARRVRGPRDELRVVEHRVVHLVPLDRRRERHGVRLVLELRRVHAHDDEHVAVLLLQLAHLVEHVQAVDAAEGPEVEDHGLAAQVGEGQVAAAGVEPAAADELGRTDARGSGGAHRPILRDDARVVRRGAVGAGGPARREWSGSEKPARDGLATVEKATTGPREASTMATTSDRRSTAGAGLSEQERAAMQERASELRKQAKTGRGNKAAADQADVLARIAEMPAEDRALAERVHALVTRVAPDLAPRLYYGQP